MAWEFCKKCAPGAKWCRAGCPRKENTSAVVAKHGYSMLVKRMMYTEWENYDEEEYW